MLDATGPKPRQISRPWDVTCKASVRRVRPRRISRPWDVKCDTDIGQTSANREAMASRGTRTRLKARKPLSCKCDTIRGKEGGPIIQFLMRPTHLNPTVPPNRPKQLRSSAQRFQCQAHHAVEAELGANVADANAGERLVLLVPQRHEKVVHAFVHTPR